MRVDIKLYRECSVLCRISLYNIITKKFYKSYFTFTHLKGSKNCTIA